MDDFPVSYREVIPNQTLPEKWKEFTLNTGGTQSTLQDIKVTQRAGGYYYRDQSKPYTGKRFIYWRMYDDILELVEHSLDVNLVGNHVRYRFQDSPVLEGVTIHETSQFVVVLLSTVSSVHRLTFPHPERINKQEFAATQHSDATVKSIFAEASAAAFRDPLSFNVINSSASNTLMPHTSACWLCPNSDILYALAYASGAVLLARHDANNGTMTTTELKQDSLTHRFLSGLTGALRGRPNEENVPASMIFHSMGSDTFLFSLSRSGSLRVWSCSKVQCVMVADVLEDATDSGKNMALGAQSHVLRKASGSFKDNELLVGVFLCFASSSECQFVVLQIACQNGVFRHSRLFSIHAPRGQDLVDFSLCRSQLWAVWRNTQGETVVSTVKMNVGASSNAHWQTAVLEPGPEREFAVTDPMTDPRQAYISYIFYPGRFSLPVIMKALSIFRRVPGFPLYEDVVSTSLLKSHVCQAVEQEINNEASSYDLTDEEYLEVANRCWAKLYSCCVQYHVASSRPIGLVLLPGGGSHFGVALVNKAYVSLLRRADYVETLFTCPPNTLSSLPFSGLNPDVVADVLILVKVVNDLEEQLTDEIKSDFEREMQRLNSPDDIAADLVRDLLTRNDYEETQTLDPHFLATLELDLSHLKDPAVAMSVILEALDQQHLKETPVTGQDTSRHLLAVRFLFGSLLGTSMLAETMRQMVTMRLNVCRNLLILQQLLIASDSEEVSEECVAKIRTALVPRTVIWTQAYYVLQWLCQTPVTPSLKMNALETNIQRMAILRLSDSSAGALSLGALPMGSRSGPQPTQTLFELFVSTAGARRALVVLSQHVAQQDGFACWSKSVLMFTSILMQMVWPINDTFIFPEFLMSSCQYTIVQQYVRLLNKWCQTNISSRNFLLGLAFLDMREPHKALDLLVEAARGIASEDFLATKIVPTDEECSEERLQIIYFLKVIQLFEQQNYPDYVIQLAEKAIFMADKNDPDLATLYSVAFVNHLRLDHPLEAFHSLNANPDSARKKDCLKELVLTLLERKRLDLLLEFPYDTLSHDLERIVESRARSLDVNNPIFYNFLYAFHVKKGNMRKAASTMYEQGVRLGLEGSHGVETTERQAKCYLACLNALELVDPRFAWIAYPVIKNMEEDGPEEMLGDRMMSPKRNSCGDEVESTEWRRQVKVVELSHIRLEYKVVQCRLRLIRHSSEKYSRTGCMLSPAELVAVLAQSGMYQAAVQLAQSHKLSCQPVLESLASACVRLSLAGEGINKEIDEAWKWLGENDLSDIGVGDGSAVTMAWRLLEDILKKCEEDRLTILHKSVATRLLGLGVFLPNWLVMSYKERNPAELLRLLMGAGRLEEASELGVEMVWAALGRGTERLGFPNALHVMSPPVCLPHNTLHWLQLELEAAAKDDPEYQLLLNDFSPLYDDYLKKAFSISRDFESAALKVQ